MPAVIIALLIGSSAPWWWQPVMNWLGGSREVARAELMREGVARVKSFRERFELCKIPSTFLVDEKIAFVDGFTNDLLMMG